jgi:hypothetical protein
MWGSMLMSRFWWRGDHLNILPRQCRRAGTWLCQTLAKPSSRAFTRTTSSTNVSQKHMTFCLRRRRTWHDLCRCPRMDPGFLSFLSFLLHWIFLCSHLHTGEDRSKDTLPSAPVLGPTVVWCTVK